MEMYYVREYTPTCRFLKIINSTFTGLVDKIYILSMWNNVYVHDTLKPENSKSNGLLFGCDMWQFLVL
jgi:hypothetical protein